MRHPVGDQAMQGAQKGGVVDEQRFRHVAAALEPDLFPGVAPLRLANLGIRPALGLSLFRSDDEAVLRRVHGDGRAAGRPAVEESAVPVRLHGRGLADAEVRIDVEQVGEPLAGRRGGACVLRYCRKIQVAREGQVFT